MDLKVLETYNALLNRSAQIYPYSVVNSGTSFTSVLASAMGSAAPAETASRETAASSVSTHQDETGYDRYFDAAAKKYDISASLLKAVGKAESGFNAKAVSRCGAQGIMQLMPKTARAMGVSNSFDPAQNIMGAAKYLRQMLDRFDGNVSLAVAAYNAGPGAVARSNGIPSKGTRNYVSKVLAYADTFSDAPVSTTKQDRTIQPVQTVLQQPVQPVVEQAEETVAYPITKAEAQEPAVQSAMLYQLTQTGSEPLIQDLGAYPIAQKETEPQTEEPEPESYSITRPETGQSPQPSEEEAPAASIPTTRQTERSFTLTPARQIAEEIRFQIAYSSGALDIYQFSGVKQAASLSSGSISAEKVRSHVEAVLLEKLNGDGVEERSFRSKSFLS